MPGLTQAELERMSAYNQREIKDLTDTELADYEDLLGRRLDQLEEE